MNREQIEAARALPAIVQQLSAKTWLCVLSCCTMAWLCVLPRMGYGARVAGCWLTITSGDEVVHRYQVKHQPQGVLIVGMGLWNTLDNAVRDMLRLVALEEGQVAA